MGIRIIKTIFCFTIFMLTFYSMLKAQSVSVASRIKDAKGYAFYYCINKHYVRYDSVCIVKSKDYSGSYFVQESLLSIADINKIETFIDKNYSSFYPGSPAENRNGNMVCLGCWRLYESFQFENYLRKIFLHKKKKKLNCLIVQTLFLNN